MRRGKLAQRLPLPGVAVAGAVVGHMVAYALAVPEGPARLALLLTTGHAYWSAAIAGGLVLGSVSLVTTLLRHFRAGLLPDHPRPAMPLGRLAAQLAGLQVAIYLVQEVLERVAVGVPLASVLDARLLGVGVAVQVAIALCLAVLLCTAGAAAEAAGRALRQLRYRPEPTSRPVPGPIVVWPSRLLAGGHGSRAPPRSSIVLQRRQAAKTVRNVHVLIHRALRDAVRWGQVVRNVADAADPPKVKPAELQVWNPAQLRAFLNHVEGDRQYAAWLLAATTGMRRGELLGLRWVDVDLNAARVAVRRPRVVADHAGHISEPKTARSRRSIALDPVTVTALREHQARQATNRAAVGPAYEDSGLVFTNPDGSPIHPHLFSDWFKQHVRAAGLPMIRLHDLRHSYATAALAAGIPAKVVSERLGHTTIAITMDTYSHVLPGLDERAAVTVARLILEGDEPEPTDSIDKPLTTGRIVPSTTDPAEGGGARSARSDVQRRRVDKHANTGAPGPSLWVTTQAWGRVG